MTGPGTRAGGTASYGEPFFWWGPVWSPLAPRSVIDLLHQGVFSVPTAALLWALLARRASLAVIAGPSGAGKTTVLTALLDFLPAGTHRLYLRGCYESFAFVDDPALAPARSVLLVNEISPHFPAYLWGPGVGRALAAAHRGFMIALTAHAATVAEFVAFLTAYPLRVPIRDVGVVSLVLTLAPQRPDHPVPPIMSGLWAIHPGGDSGLRIEPLTKTAPDGTIRPDLVAARFLIARLASAAPAPDRQPFPATERALAGELAGRARLLDHLSHGDSPAPATIVTALAAWEEEAT